MTCEAKSKNSARAPCKSPRLFASSESACRPQQNERPAKLRNHTRHRLPELIPAILNRQHHRRRIGKLAANLPGEWQMQIRFPVITFKRLADRPPQARPVQFQQMQPHPASRRNRHNSKDHKCRPREKSHPRARPDHVRSRTLADTDKNWLDPARLSRKARSNVANSPPSQLRQNAGTPASPYILSRHCHTVDMRYLPPSLADSARPAVSRTASGKGAVPPFPAVTVSRNRFSESHFCTTAASQRRPSLRMFGGRTCTLCGFFVPQNKHRTPPSPVRRHQGTPSLPWPQRTQKYRPPCE